MCSGILSGAIDMSGRIAMRPEQMDAGRSDFFAFSWKIVI